ncbi:enoyl-CoA hydratase-related protein [Metabacillus herbersteinensis]|uniref:Enoyl-CoA hydratase-related protein n=1 Tax=Metabacillus herbersteinensis TaxID=283816 RepID=A0ABV6GLM5_9BACI
MNTLLYEVENYIATITLNRADVLNCFNFEMLIELETVLDEIRTNKEVRVVIITGAGEKSFSAGADLRERKSLSEQEVRRFIFKIGEVFSKVDQLPQPVIAAVNGFAFGGGMEFALACDVRILVEGTRIGLTETSLAIIPGAGGTQRLPRLIGEAKALELILTARKLTSSEALAYGIVSRVVPTDELMDVALKLAQEMLGNGPLALQQAKFAIKQGMNVDLATGLKLEQKAYEVLIPTVDRVEALNAFGEKRRANFRGE